MMRIAGDAAIAIGGSWALSLIVKATLVFIAALAAARLARRARASVRHVLLATGFVALLALPLFSLVAPARAVAVPVALPTLGVAHSESLAPMPRTSTQPTAASVALSDAPPSRPAGASPAAVLVALWIAGAAFFLAAMLAGMIRVTRVSRSGVPWLDGQALVTDIAAAAAIHRRIDLVLNETTPGPVTCGVLRPTIVLPQEAQTWDRQDLERAIVHEVEHIRRLDWLMLCVARAVCAIYWFHPLVWIAWRRLRLEAERACDDAVLLRSQAEAYADQLVTLAERLASHAPQSALAMANRGDLSARVRAVLDAAQQRGRAGRPVVAAACAAAGLLLTTVGPLKTVAAAGASQAAASSRMVIRPLQLPYFLADSPQPQPVSLEWLDGDEWAFQVQSIIRNEELLAYSRLKTAQQRDAFIARFWAERDPSPGTPENEFQAEYTRRVQFGIERFQASQAGFGFETNRGRISLIFGAPDAIESEGTGDSRAETWRYSSVPGLGSDFRIRFYGNHCDHRIVSPSPIRTIEAVAAGGPVNEPMPRSSVQIYPHGMTVISVPLNFPGVVGAAYDLHNRQGLQVDQSQIGWMDGGGKSELLSQHLPRVWLDAGLGCTWALPADTYTLSTTLRFVNGQVQRETATFDVP